MLSNVYQDVNNHNGATNGTRTHDLLITKSTSYKRMKPFGPELDTELLQRTQRTFKGKVI